MMRTRDLSDPSERRTDSTDDAAICPECAGHLVTEGGETSGLGCGLIVAERWLDYRGKRTFSGGEFTEDRAGAPLTQAGHDRGLSTEIGVGADAKGNPLSGGKRRTLGRLRTHHSRSRFRSKGERNLAHGLGEIDRLRSSLDLPKTVRDRACVLFRRAQRENLILGRSIEEMAAGCVYAACRELRWLRTLDEVAAVSSRPKSAVRNAYRVLSAELGITAPPPHPGDYLARFASRLDAPTGLRARAAEFAEAAEASGLANGRNPAGIAAACLYLAARDGDRDLTQAEVAAVASVSTVTVRMRTRELLELEATTEPGDRETGAMGG